MDRPDGRAIPDLRPISFVPNVAPNATGSFPASSATTRAICAATVEDTVPRWMKFQNVEGGWISAEYSMLPYSTHGRKQRDISRGKLDGRSSEIQRLIGRSLRAVIDLKKLGKRTIWIDCDVLQADGGTRTTAVSGAWIALHDAFTWMKEKRQLREWPLMDQLGAVSVGVVDGLPVCDLDYIEDSKADTDMNLVMTGNGEYIEVQGSAEGAPFNRTQLDSMLELGEAGIQKIFAAQKAALEGS